MAYTINSVKPGQIEASSQYVDTFGTCEMETVAANIVAFAKQNGNTWSPFTFEEYVRQCSGLDTDVEPTILDEMVQSGFLTKSDGRYSITDLFIERLARCIIE